jgi:hypothetical protein
VSLNLYHPNKGTVAKGSIRTIYLIGSITIYPSTFFFCF